VPRIIDYPEVLDRLTKQGLVCNYHNSGSFGFPRGSEIQIRGWIGPPDSTIKPALLDRAQSVPLPYEMNLAKAATKAWRETLPGPAWLMPSSHWHFELHDGSRDWMPAALAELGLDAADLRDRNNGAAIEFQPQESDLFCPFVQKLLTHLNVSDFQLAFPGRPALCMVHHFKQLWWTTTDGAIARHLIIGQ